MTNYKNYDENFSDAQYYPIDESDETEFLWEFEGGSLESGYED
jgi:hypothetical protein